MGACCAQRGFRRPEVPREVVIRSTPCVVPSQLPQHRSPVARRCSPPIRPTSSITELTSPTTVPTSFSVRRRAARTTAESCCGLISSAGLAASNSGDGGADAERRTTEEELACTTGEWLPVGEHLPEALLSVCALGYGLRVLTCRGGARPSAESASTCLK